MNRRNFLAGVALTPALAGKPAVPPAVEAACEAFRDALSEAARLDAADAPIPRQERAVDRVEAAELAAVGAMRSHGLSAAKVGSRLYVDSWGRVRVLDLSAVAGLA